MTDAQQYRIHMGDEEAFAEFFYANNMRVYHRALAVLQDKVAARAAVIEAFTAFRAEIKAADGPIDADGRLFALTEDAIVRVDELRKAAPAQTHDIEPLSAREIMAAELPLDDSTDEIRHDGKKFMPKWVVNLIYALLALLFTAAFFWLLLGALMRGGAIPFRDWGYTWFNEHVFSRFNIRL